MIRFSAALVVVAVGILVGGMAASDLLLVYVAIGLSVAALAALALGVALKREELFGEQGQSLAGSGVVSGQSALAGQGANVSFGQERPGPAASGERSTVPGKQDAFGEPSGQQTAAFGQAAWAAAQDMHSGRPGNPSHSDGPPTPPTSAPLRTGGPWSPPAAPAAAPGPEIPPWRERERFAPPAPLRPAAQQSALQQPAPQTRVDTTRIRTDLARTRADLTAPKADSGETRVDLTEVVKTGSAETKAGPAETRVDSAETRVDLTEVVKADPAETKADTAPPGRPFGLSWFERLASAQPAGDDMEAEDAAAADSPAGDTHAEDATVIADDVTVIKDIAEDVTVIKDAVTVIAENEASGAGATVDTAAEGVTEVSAARPDAQAQAEDSASAEATVGSPAGSSAGDQDGRSGQREVTVVPGVPRYHDANCILIRFMGDDDLQKTTLDEATEAGCTPCRACMAEHA